MVYMYTIMLYKHSVPYAYVCTALLYRLLCDCMDARSRHGGARAGVPRSSSWPCLPFQNLALQKTLEDP